MNDRQMDMTQGRPGKILIFFAVPIFFGNVFQQLYNICDSIIVGQFVGADALAAVGICGSPHGVFVALNMGLSTGIGIMVAQMFGARQEKRIRATIVNALLLICSSAVVTGGVGFAASSAVLRLLGTPEGIFADALIYMRLLFINTLGMAAYNCVTGILRAMGDSRTPLYFLVFSSILNILLNVLLVTVIPLGVMGVGLATVLANLISAAAVFIYARKKYVYFRFGADEIRAEKDIILSLLRAGLPLGLQSTTISISAMVLQGFVNSFGETVIAANTVIVKFDNLLNMPLNSLSMALSTYTGQNIGAGMQKRIKEGYHTSLRMAAVYSAVVFIIGHTCGEMFVKLFVNAEPELLDYGARGIAIYSSVVISLAMIYINRSILNGSGDTAFAMVIGLVEIIGRVGFAFLYVTVLKSGPQGLWYTAVSNWTLTGLVCLIRYLSGAWKKKAYISFQS